MKLYYPALMTTTFALLIGAQFSGCNDNNPAPSQPAAPSGTVFQRYGGATTITKIVDDAVTGLIADCKENPFFTTVLDMPGHDSSDRLKSCLDLFFTNALGGPATYPGPSHFRNAPPEGYPCEDMATAHNGLGIPSDVFDQFVSDLGAVLKKDGVSDADITIVAQKLTGLKDQVVTAPGTEMNFNYTPTNPAANGCTTSPSPSPSASPTSADDCTGMADGTPCGGETCATSCSGVSSCGSRVYHYCLQSTCHGTGILCTNPSPSPSPSPVTR